MRGTGGGGAGHAAGRRRKAAVGRGGVRCALGRDGHARKSFLFVFSSSVCSAVVAADATHESWWSSAVVVPLEAVAGLESSSPFSALGLGMTPNPFPCLRVKPSSAQQRLP